MSNPLALARVPSDAAVRVDRDERGEDRLVEDRVDDRVGAARRRRQPLDLRHHGVDALVLVAVDRALEQRRRLDRRRPRPRASPATPPGRSARSRGPPRSCRTPSRCASVSRASIVTRYSGRPCTERPATSTFMRPLDAARDLLQRAADRVHRDVREAPGRLPGLRPVRQVGRRVRLRRPAPRRPDRRLRLARAQREHQHGRAQRAAHSPSPIEIPSHLVAPRAG